eukprot:268078-Rhodomonas_salina.3
MWGAEGVGGQSEREMQARVLDPSFAPTRFEKEFEVRAAAPFDLEEPRVAALLYLEETPRPLNLKSRGCCKNAGV